MLLPGAYYGTMKEVQKEHLDTEHYDEFGAEKMKAKFFKQYVTEDYAYAHQETPKIGFSLYDYVQLDDSTFNYLSQIRFVYQC